MRRQQRCHTQIRPASQRCWEGAPLLGLDSSPWLDRRQEGHRGCGAVRRCARGGGRCQGRNKGACGGRDHRELAHLGFVCALGPGPPSKHRRHDQLRPPCSHCLPTTWTADRAAAALCRLLLLVSDLEFPYRRVRGGGVVARNGGSYSLTGWVGGWMGCPNVLHTDCDEALLKDGNPSHPSGAFTNKPSFLLSGAPSPARRYRSKLHSTSHQISLNHTTAVLRISPYDRLPHCFSS